MLCHLRKFSQNSTRSQSKTAETFEIVVDKMHFKGHVDAWCRQHCDPYKHSHLDKVFALMQSFEIR